MDSDLFIFQNTVEDTLSQERMMALLSGSFGALAAILTMVGLYGVISYITTMRRNEIGIRMALGADRGNVLGLISKQTLQMLGAGVLLGILLSLAATRGAASLLFGLRPNDPLSIFTPPYFSSSSLYLPDSSPPIAPRASIPATRSATNNSHEDSESIRCEHTPRIHPMPPRLLFV